MLNTMSVNNTCNLWGLHSKFQWQCFLSLSSLVLFAFYSLLIYQYAIRTMKPRCWHSSWASRLTLQTCCTRGNPVKTAANGTASYGSTMLSGTISPPLSKLQYLKSSKDLGNSTGPFTEFLFSLPYIDIVHITNNKVSSHLWRRFRFLEQVDTTDDSRPERQPSLGHHPPWHWSAPEALRVEFNLEPTLRYNILYYLSNDLAYIDE